VTRLERFAAELTREMLEAFSRHSQVCDGDDSAARAVAERRVRELAEAMENAPVDVEDFDAVAWLDEPSGTIGGEVG
jgi:hypothetical protein